MDFDERHDTVKMLCMPQSEQKASTYHSQLWETVLYCAPSIEKLKQILQETIWRCEADLLHSASNAEHLAECKAKIAGNMEMLAWMEGENE